MNKTELYVEEILNICEGKLLTKSKDIAITSFSKDTRTINKEDMYVAIKGENFNGNSYVKDALENGAIGAIVDEEIPEEVLEKYSNKPIIKVENTVNAIGKLAIYKREKYSIPVVAITGSVGKTTSKNIITQVLETKFNVLKTEGNLNNLIGLPLTILKLKEEHTALVVEMGMNHFGEIEALSKIAKPTIAVITNIGTSHIGNLGSKENILKAKLEILSGLEDGGTLVINNDDEFLSKFYYEYINRKLNVGAPAHRCPNKGIKVLTCGINSNSNFTAEDIHITEDGSSFNTNINGKTYKVNIPVPGKHYICNGLLALAIGDLLQIDEVDVVKALGIIKPEKMRMEIIKSALGVTIVNDCYNASYESVKAALEYLSKISNKRKIAVLGGIGEVGDFAKEIHTKIGEEVYKNSVDVLITVGNDAKNIAYEFEKRKNSNAGIHICSTNEEAVGVLKSILKPNDMVLIKGSRMMKMEEIVDSIR
ncbi:MAG: UDP-N-acetylmuramoyl-tripeptide--D-alanyl-D-alanine ligase [Lachnospiraceae bacterium]|jgi:UDP-N-acetylmuramoyl-tripeptide--D-alanyl-D-alanine ligase|nr:UDP-N-acetylmuramoyl-tripeptide--D-alanyl-D-alanine ligase [Lachnospiraceae bacterium]